MTDGDSISAIATERRELDMLTGMIHMWAGSSSALPKGYL